MSRLTSVSLIALTSLSMMLAGCQKKAEGQVVAVVNGEEITANELNSEIASRNIPANVDKKVVRADVLQQMVDRRLLAQAAKDQGLDRDPTYISRERVLKENLLVEMYAKKALDTVAVPDAAKVDQFIASHPSLFADRVKFRLDQVIFNPPADMAKLKELNGVHSIDGIVEWLKKNDIKFQRGPNALDSASLPPELVGKIKALPPGEPFIIPANGKIVANAVTAQEPVSLTIEQERPLATQAMRQEELGKIGQQRLKDAKDKAKIEYQPGYEPRKPSTAAAAPAGK